MSSSNPTRLEDVCLKITDGSHFSPKATNIGYPMLSVKDMTDYGFDYSACKRISDDDYETMLRNDCVPRINDVLVAKDGSYLKHIFVTKEQKDEAILSSIAIFRPNTDKINPQYLCYLLQNPMMKRVIKENYVSGSALPRIVLKDFKKIQIEVPALSEQKAIAATLSCLDDMIELNNRTNKVLEEITQAIFKRWFVDFEFPNEEGEPYKSSGGEMVDSELGVIPKGWGIKLLGDCIESIDNRGKTPPLSNIKTNYPIIDVKALSGDSRIIDYGNCTKYVNRDIYENWFRSGHPSNYDILLSTVGSLAQMKLFLGDVGCIAQNVVGFRSTGVSPLFLYEYLKSIRNDLISYDIGSVQPSIKVTHILKHKILLPNNVLLNAYDRIAKDISILIYQNSTLNQKIASIRDTLIPKLMSGEIRVPVEEVV